MDGAELQALRPKAADEPGTALGKTVNSVELGAGSHSLALAVLLSLPGRLPPS